MLVSPTVNHSGMRMETPGFDTTGDHIDILQDRLGEEGHSSEPCALRRSVRQNAGQHSNPNRLPRATHVHESLSVALVVNNQVDPAVLATIAETQLCFIQEGYTYMSHCRSRSHSAVCCSVHASITNFPLPRFLGHSLAWW